jgi:hypothetical protein
MGWPDLNREIALVLPVLDSLERLHIAITAIDMDFTALQSLIENMPKSYQTLELTDMHSSANTCSQFVDLLAATPRMKPKRLVIHGIELVHAGWLKGLIKRKLDIPFQWTQIPDLNHLSFDVDCIWTCDVRPVEFGTISRRN